MTAVLSPTDAFRKENIMASLDDHQLNFSSSTDWKSKYYEVAEMLSETRNELDDFHQSSKDLEEELERELQRTEKAQQDLRVKVERAENERDEWKSKFMSLQTTHNKTTTSLQREIDTLRQDHQKIKVQLRELEMGNDDLERTERAVSSSLADVEAKYSRALEEKILLEHELIDKASLEEECQRVKDELRGAHPRRSILLHLISPYLSQTQTQKSQRDSSSSNFFQRNPQNSDDDLLHTQPPADLTLSDLSPESDSPSPVTTTPRQVSSPLNKDAGQSALLQRAGFSTRTKVSSPQASPFSGRSTTMPSLTTPTRLPPRTALTRPTPRTPMSPITGNTMAAIPATVSKNKGVQMVSEMRARVRNLEQKIHTRVPRLRMGSTSTRAASGSISNPKPPSSVSSTTSSNSSLQPRTSDERVRPSLPSLLTRRSDDSVDKKQTPRRESAGWVLIMEDSPSPLKTKDKEMRKLTGSTTVPSYRPYQSAAPDSPSRRPRPAVTKHGHGPHATEGRSSAGTTATTSSLATPVSRPTTPTFLPLPSNGLYSNTSTPSTGGFKRSTGPGSGAYSSNHKRSSLGSSTNVSPMVFNHLSDGGYPHRERPTSVPAPPRGLDNTRLPSPGSMTSLSQSKIGKPNFGVSGRRSSGGADSDLELILGDLDKTLGASTTRRR
ncbi:hypothetical protein HETIRDRAFT_153883 [Heterobasidion irregulare TC 32-1]|uniref:NUDE domain-containing protein n=1 Tax=Heterobasidion irregulare (strain TC 32-1) TaxID=747525 RepID=W4KNR4_HETIT|nr:uncharacterized protein HETIRDRAFT_153883 [Heterobasidion irregulare TC 32-1]ETW87329.1 hypothetical protein HETIRDRAFT_153883 [Heterobasidion irregulare TC 32-1]